MTKEQRRVLGMLADARKRGSFAVACHGADLDAVNQLCAKGLADWRGTSYGSSFYSISDAGEGENHAEPR